ncbi:MAG: Jag N-terminal domain-containing protein [Oscillospiraceae bacterium]|nr:Jag N-terminal domain-containing protein [Oscillospiraceae bacterium]
MQKEIFETGKTVDAAIDSACEKLGCKREDCQWEIIDLPKKGFLGLKNNPAKVRVSIEVPDEKPKPEQKKPEPEQPQKQVKQKPPQPAFREKRAKSEQPKKQKEIRETKPAVVVDEAKISEKEKIAKEYLQNILKSAGLDAEFKIVREHGGSSINITGEGLGMIIGRRGETLDALQYLTSLVANRGGDYVRFTIDCGEYRMKRKDTLEALARKLASQVLKTNVSKTLEPMNPFERRIIHSTVYEIEGVSSLSVGEEPNRRVVITSPTAKPTRGGGYRQGGGVRPSMPGRGRPPERGARSDRPDRRDRGDRDRGRGGRQQASPATSGPPKQTPEAEATTGISFGKIDLE